MTDVREYNETYDCFIIDPRYKHLDWLISYPENYKPEEVEVELCDVMLDKDTREAVHGEGEYALWKGFFHAFKCRSGGMDLVRKDDYDAAIGYWVRYFKPILVYYWGYDSYGFRDRYGMCYWEYKENKTTTKEEAVRVAWNYIYTHRSNVKWMNK